MANLTTKIAHILSGDVISKGFGFILTIYLTRILGTEGFGMVTVALAYLGYAVFFADFGLFTIGSREVAKSPDKRLFTPFEILNARIILALTIFGLTWFILPFIISDSNQLQLTRGFTIALIIHAFLIEWYYNGVQKYDVNAISKTIHTGVYALGAFLFVKNTDQIQNLPYAYVVGLIISTTVLLIISYKDWPFVRNKSAITVYKDLIKSASTIGSGLLFVKVILLLPPIMIGIFISTSDAGIYGAAFRLILIGLLIDRLFVQLLIPNLAKQWVENKDRALVNMEHSGRIMLFTGASVAIFIAVGASDISMYLFGESFSDSAPVIVMLSLYLFLTFQNSMFSHGLIAIGNDTDYFKATSYGGVIAVILVVTSSIYFDVRMVALAVAISEFFIAMLCYQRFRKFLSFQYIFPFLSTLVFGVSTFFLASFIEMNLILKAFISATFLGVILILFRVLRINDVKWLKAVLFK